MKDKIEQVEKAICEVNQIYDLIWQGEGEMAINQFSRQVTMIGKILQELISNIPALDEAGVQLPVDIIMQQMNNLTDALQYKDEVMLADTLRYEIGETLNVYLEILKQPEAKDILRFIDSNGEL